MYGNEAENNHCSLLCVHVRLLCGYHCCLWKLNRNYRAILMHARRQFLSPIQVKNYSLLSQKTSWQGAFNLLWGVRKWIRYNWSLNSNSFWSLVMAASHSLYNFFFFFFLTWSSARVWSYFSIFANEQQGHNEQIIRNRSHSLSSANIVSFDIWSLVTMTMTATLRIKKKTIPD